ncbi:DUF262 domain-containing protein [Pedobacter roseus]|uniref:DUF262 domain-containing protein n=1 Tax=Pedobacter roseus TaxID=336820 RepID=A0A7G9QJX2_9SPHI|nr:DUF262 domain-containing protein [Pedobacter roseus]QNN43647.1 DUF262 domain-containing protein [Pedobacter roseus]
MKEFIYALEDLFIADKLLNDLQADHYYIAAYQRGYKWKSFGPNDQVPLFLTDIYEAFIVDTSEYYLQYITVKKNDEHKNWLEVIDGQQRLTTISLLFYSFATHFGFENITKNKVQYERYQNRAIFDEVIAYDKEDAEIAKLLTRHQDLYYIYHAKVCIASFLELLAADEAKSFYDYCRQKVKIIINLEDEMTAAEEIFSNLNDNKVDLTNYYLIKGLLFTKSTRPEHQKKLFNEIQEQRNRIARNWDEIDNWLHDEVQNQLFFNKYITIGNEKNIGINSLLNALKPVATDSLQNIPLLSTFIEILKLGDTSAIVDDYKLFNCYNDNLKTQAKAEAQLANIHQTSKRLKNWFSDNEIHNLIGYYIYTNGKLDEILHLGSSDLKKSLYQHLNKTLQFKGRTIKELNYTEDRPLLNVIFLALNVFALKNDIDNVVIDFTHRFDFHTYRNNDWSIEHIYPQHPDCSLKDYEEYYDWFLDKVERKEEHFNEQLIEKVKQNQQVNEEELEALANKGFDEHQLGNLALLQSGNNSALKNYIFPKKRKILLNLITKGAFVPQHTINTVSKLLNNVSVGGEGLGFSQKLTEWEEADIAANSSWIVSTYNHLITILATK